MVEAIFTIISTVIDSVLSKLAQSRRDKKERTQRTEAVRTLLSLEIDTNLQELTDFWVEANKTDEPAKDDDSRKVQLARRIIQLPFPNISRDALQSQMGQLPVAMDKEYLPRVLQVYNRLTRLQALRNVLAIASQEQKADWALASQGRGFVPLHAAIGLSRRFDNSAPAICDEFTDMVNILMADGNPLQST
jgi:hypothetical protein